jgi:hypothetical protein
MNYDKGPTKGRPVQRPIKPIRVPDLPKGPPGPRHAPGFEGPILPDAPSPEPMPPGDAPDRKIGW